MKTFLVIVFACMLSCTHGQQPEATESNQPRFELATSTLEEAGFNRDSIDVILDLIRTTAHKDFRGVVVIKDNAIVLEEYFNTFWRNSISDIRSAGKSVTAILLGIAIKEGLIQDLDQNIHSLFSPAKNPSINEQYKSIKLRDLLDMSSGLDADSDDSSTPGQAGNWIAKDDWKRYLLNVPLAAKPGEAFVYADINPVLIGLAIEEASGMSLRDYAHQKLFAPLGIRQFYWYTNASNQTGAAGNLYLGALDLAKLGTLIINDGKWGGNQIFNPDYAQAIIESKNPAIVKAWPWVDSYGMFWYKKSRKFGDTPRSYLYASGIGGNHLVVFPKEAIVIALTSSAYGQPYQHGRSEAIMEKILMALE